MTQDAGGDYVATIYGNGAHYFAVRNVNSQWYRVDSLHQSPIPITHIQYMEWMQQGYLRVIRRPQGLTDSDIAGNLRRLHMPSSEPSSVSAANATPSQLETEGNAQAPQQVFSSSSSSSSSSSWASSSSSSSSSATRLCQRQLLSSSKSDPYECNFKQYVKLVDETGQVIGYTLHYKCPGETGPNNVLVESLARSTLPREKEGFAFSAKKLKELEDAPRKQHYADKIGGSSGSSAYIAFGKKGHSSKTNNFFMPIDGILDSDSLKDSDPSLRQYLGKLRDLGKTLGLQPWAAQLYLLEQFKTKHNDKRSGKEDKPFFKLLVKSGGVLVVDGKKIDCSPYDLSVILFDANYQHEVLSSTRNSFTLHMNIAQAGILGLLQEKENESKLINLMRTKFDKYIPKLFHFLVSNKDAAAERIKGTCTCA